MMRQMVKVGTLVVALTLGWWLIRADGYFFGGYFNDSSTCNSFASKVNEVASVPVHCEYGDYTVHKAS